jgi:DNA polymerase II small subunit/DNA polymerase delta subunit B
LGKDDGDIISKVPAGWNVVLENGSGYRGTRITLPSLLEIGGVSILLMQGEFLENYQKIFDVSPEAAAVNMLKKRHMNPTFEFNRKIYKDDPFFLDEIPDILVFTHFRKPGTANYKGTTVISNGSFSTEPIYWIINLKTRETIKINFT